MQKTRSFDHILVLPDDRGYLNMARARPLVGARDSTLEPQELTMAAKAAPAAPKKNGTPAKKPGKTREVVVVGSKVKDVIREAGLRSDGELIQAISDTVHEMLEQAIERTKGNGRGTVRPYDL